MTIKLNLVVLRADDVDVLARFYTALGMEFKAHQHGKGVAHWAWESADGILFEIYPKRGAADHTQHVRLGFIIDNLDHALSVLDGDGHAYKIVSKPQLSPWGRRMIIDDPEGHRIELIERSNS